MSAAAPDVTVIIATRSRSASLARLLETLAAQQTGGAFTFDVLVADNGSTDETREMVQRLQPAYPVPLRYLYEGRPGKPWALNAALAEAQGGLFAFADDDIEATPSWLASLWSCVRDTGADAVTGKALPRWIGEKPSWLTEEAFRHIGGMGCIDWGPARLAAREGHDCRWVGGNMAIRREAAARLGGFDVRMLRGQDTEYYRRAVSRGLHVVYEPSAVSYHKIPAERLTPAYFRRWRDRSGQFQVHLIPWKVSHVLTVMPWWRYRKTGLLAWLWLQALLRRRPWWERFGYELMWREDLSIWRSRLALLPRWWLTTLTGRSFMPSARTEVRLRAPSLMPHPSEPVPFVSVVVPVLNGAATIEACVQSLLAQEYPRQRYEVLVVDNGSTDETPAIIRRHPVTFLRESRRSSYAARNRGIASARGELIAFTDADCVAAPGWISRLVAGHEDPVYGGFAGRVEAHEPSSVLERFAARRQQVSNDASMACSFLPYAITANAAYRRELLQALGGFDERLISGGDADLSWRLQQQGRRLRFNTDAVVRHRHRAALRPLLRQHRLYGVGTAMLYERYPGYRRSLAYEAWFWLRRSAQFLVRGLFRLARDPLARRDGGLYAAEHILEVVATTNRFLGILHYRLQGCSKPEDVPGTQCFVEPGGPTVSVVIPAYNRAALIGQAIESVLAQTYQDFEIIVVDDGSTDGTRAAVDAYAARAQGRLRYLYQSNQGLSAARNAGCAAGRGRYLAFLDSDDLWLPEKLARQLPLLEADHRVGLVSSMAEVVDAANSRVLGLKPKQAPGTTLAELVERGSAAPSTFVARREALEEVGYFDPLITKGIEDLDLCFRLAGRWKLVCVAQPLIRYRLHATNISADPEGTCRGFIRAYEKLLASANGGISRARVRRLLARRHYQLGSTYARRRQARPAVREVARAVRLSPLVGLSFATEGQPWGRRATLAVKPYLLLCGLSAAALVKR